MEDNNKRPPSPVTCLYTELQRLLTADQYEQIFPLINSAVGTNNTNDEEIAQQQQEQLYQESSMDVDEPLATALASFDTRSSEEIDADTAYALQLQEEEYAKHNNASSRSYQNATNNDKFPCFVIDPDEELALSDAELAAQLQEEENQKQPRQRQRPTFPSQRRIPRQTTNRNDEPEVIPVPFLSRPTNQRSAANRNNNNNNNNRAPNDFFSLLQLLANPNQLNPGNHGIENNNEDFTSDDYENLLELDNAVDKNALNSEQINRLPTEKFRRPANQNDEENKCNVCWDQFEQNQILRRLPCLHLYHKDCIDPWLKKNNACPICRMPPIKK